MPPVCLDMPICLDAGGHPNRGAFKHTGGASKHMVASKDTGSIQMYGGIWRPLSLTKHAFCVVYVQGHPNVWGHMDTPLV